jgi:O-antigen ligase
MGEFLDKVIAITLLLVVVFAAAAHGVVEPWSVFILESITAVLILLWIIKAVAEKSLSIVIPNTTWPLLGLILLGLAQSMAWSMGSMGSMGSGVSEGGDGMVRQSLSFDVDSTRGTVLMLCSLLALSVLAANFLTGATRLRSLTKFMICFGALLGIFGLVQYFSGSNSIYWFRQTRVTAFGPFFNRDHFAGYMELFIGLPVALILTRSAKGELRLICGVAAMFMGMAAVFTLSRGGMISIVAELIFLAAMSLRHNRAGGKERGKARMAMSVTAVVTILAAIVTGVIWLGAEPVINRIATGDPTNSDLSKAQSFYSHRGVIWENTWTMIRNNPLLGVGLGAYETAYPSYARENGGEGITAEAHNDYLQILADAGVIGAAFALSFIILLFRSIARGVRTTDPLLAAIALGGGAGVFGLLVHSLFDFNLHLPSHAIVFLFLATVISQIGATVVEPAPLPIKSGKVEEGVAPALVREVSS